MAHKILQGRHLHYHYFATEPLPMWQCDGTCGFACNINSPEKIARNPSRLIISLAPIITAELADTI
jgi:hypothetical protein